MPVPFHTPWLLQGPFKPEGRESFSWLEVFLPFYKTETKAKALKSNVIGMSTWSYLSILFFLKNICNYMLLAFQPKLQLNSATGIKGLNPSSDQPPCYGHGCARTADVGGGENSKQQKLLRQLQGTLAWDLLKLKTSLLITCNIAFFCPRDLQAMSTALEKTGPGNELKHRTANCPLCSTASMCPGKGPSQCPDQETRVCSPFQWAANATPASLLSPSPAQRHRFFTTLRLSRAWCTCSHLYTTKTLLQ